MKINIEQFEKNELIKKEWEFLFSDEFVTFLNELSSKFMGEWESLLTARKVNQEKINQGKFPDFLSETKSIREGDWVASKIPENILDRRVEITGPVDRKMIINGLNSGAKVYMADLEDSSSPVWDVMIDGQLNLYDAVRKQINFKNPAGKEYSLNDETAVLFVRPRGLHLKEKHLHFNGKEIPGAFLDFALYFFHNAKEILNRGEGIYYYLPKLEHHTEARMWANIFSWAEEKIGIPHGTVRVTVLIETITAAFEMDEIIFELKDYIAGLNCGRWDYIFSFIKKFHKHKDFLMPNREQVGMGVHFLNSYSLLLIETCHKRGIHAMGGMAAQIPIKNDEAANEVALNKVKQDKEREANNGHDGTWVAHPALVPVAMEIFDKFVPENNQISKQIHNEITAADLLKVPVGTINKEGFVNNVRAGLHYLAAWLDGNGCVPLNNLMEDLATAEIARSQVWQWVQYNAQMEDGQTIDVAFFHMVMDDLMKEITENKIGLVASLKKYQLANKLFTEIVEDKEFVEFFSLPAYDCLD